MQAKQIAKKLAARRMRRKLVKAVPILGPALTLRHVMRTVRDKGARRGGFDAALDLMPIVGRLKAVYESFRGDLIPARPTPLPTT